MIRYATILVLSAALLAVAMPAKAQEHQALIDEANAKASAEMGREMSTVEGAVTAPAPVKNEPDVSLEEAMKVGATAAATGTTAEAASASATETPAEEAAPATTEPEAAAVAASEEGGEAIRLVQVKGDADVLDHTGVRKDVEAEAVGKSLTDDQIKALAQKAQDALIKKGFYVARVWPASPAVVDGVLTLVVDQGRIGKISLFKRQGDKTVPYKGRWYTENQLQRRLSALKPGQPFNYSELYGTVYAFNSHPDLTTDVDLTVRKEGEGDDQRRHVDMDFEVREDRPFHAMLEFANSGTDITEEWRAGLTLQYLNLTKHDDVLTLSAPASLDLSTIRSTALSYYRPHNWRKGGSVSVFGGISELATENVVEGIDLEGNGWFAGVQGSYNFIDDNRRLLNVSLGLTHSIIEDTLIIAGDEDSLSSEAAVTPLVLAVSYGTKQPDKRGGRTTLMWATEINQGGFLGASDDEELQSQRQNASADFIIEKLQIARVRPILRDKQDPKKDWILYTRVAGQYATEPLIPGEQMGVGGQNSVRGYLENEVLADDGLVANVELRTPIRHTSTIPRWMGKPANDKRYIDYEGLQFVFFLDGAYVMLKDAVAGEDDNYQLLSVGPGLRYSIGNGFQMRLDWGFPLEKTEDSDTTGRGHFSLQFML
ncbi:MAG: ShlB/FhaC/HecB family hemolysin secretion/activation protein [bacterium]